MKINRQLAGPPILLKNIEKNACKSPMPNQRTAGPILNFHFLQGVAIASGTYINIPGSTHVTFGGIALVDEFQAIAADYDTTAGAAVQSKQAPRWAVHCTLCLKIPLVLNFIVMSCVTFETFGDSFLPLENSFRFSQIILHCK